MCCSYRKVSGLLLNRGRVALHSRFIFSLKPPYLKYGWKFTTLIIKDLKLIVNKNFWKFC